MWRATPSPPHSVARRGLPERAAPPFLPSAAALPAGWRKAALDLLRLGRESEESGPGVYGLSDGKVFQSGTPDPCAVTAAKGTMGARSGGEVGRLGRSWWEVRPGRRGRRFQLPRGNGCLLRRRAPGMVEA